MNITLSQLIGVISATAALAGAVWTGGVAWSKIDARIDRLEDTAKWRDTTDERLRQLERAKRINESRWGEHYGLWDEAIVRRKDELRRAE